jgi:hypothetical protein
MMGRGMAMTESSRLIPLPNIPLPLPFGAAKRAHRGYISMKGGNCTTHGLQKIFNTITL